MTLSNSKLKFEKKKPKESDLYPKKMVRIDLVKLFSNAEIDIQGQLWLN